EAVSMARQAGRMAQPTGEELPWMIAGGALGAGVLLVCAWWAGGLASTPVREATGSPNPATMLFGQMSGRVPVSGAQVLVFALLVVVLLAVVGLIVWAGRKQTRSAAGRVDDRARSMSRAKD